MRERRRTWRRRRELDHGIVSARVRPGHEVAVLDISAGGALVESTHRMLPGSAVELQLATRDARVAVRGRVVRCAVSAVRPSSVRYRGAISFDHYLPWFVEDGGDATHHVL